MLACPIRQHAIDTPNAIAIYQTEGKLNYRQLDLLISRTVIQLSQQGVDTNGVIGGCDDNSLELILLLFATLRLGAIFCPLAKKLTDAEKAQQINTTGIDYLWQKQNKTLSATSVCKLKLTITIDDKALFELDNNNTLSPILLARHKPATAIFTSGSSGQPKAVVHSINNHYTSALGAQQQIPLSGKDCWLASLPFHHIGGLAIVMRCAFFGASIALPKNKDLQGNLTLAPVTHASLVPTQLFRLLQHSNWREITASLRYLLLGGAPINQAMLSPLASIGIKAFHSYGLTEMCSQVATTNAGEPYFNTALPYRQWQLKDGEILVKGETLCQGYLVNGAIVALSTNSNPNTDTGIDTDNNNGWFYTKDLGEASEAGIKIIGRKDNMFICGGENYQPELVEQVLCTCEAVSEAVIVGVSDCEFGTIAVAFVRWQQQEEIEQLQRYLQQRLTRFKIPKHFFSWPENQVQELKIKRSTFLARAENLLNAQHKKSD